MPYPGRLHILIDTAGQNRFNYYQLAEMCFHAGADVVQYRNKNFVREMHLTELVQISRISKLYNKILIVNDDPELAGQVDAGGVHLGKGDATIESVRSMLGEKVLIGATAHTPEEAKKAEEKGADYIGAGPVFGTSSKNIDLPPLGLKGLKDIVSKVSVPVIAIGNIRPENVKEVMNAGAYGIAVLSAVCYAENPEIAVQEFLKRIP